MLRASYGEIERVGTDQSRVGNRSEAGVFADKGLPENQDYTDTGCELAPSCLECPLALCKYDDPSWDRRSRTVMRDQEIVRLRRKGLRVADIAKVVKTSDRTVYRVTQQKGVAPAKPSLKHRKQSRRHLTRVPQVPVEQLAVWQQYSMRSTADVEVA